MRLSMMDTSWRAGSAGTPGTGQPANSLKRPLRDALHLHENGSALLVNRDAGGKVPGVGEVAHDSGHAVGVQVEVEVFRDRRRRDEGGLRLLDPSVRR
jgi:hypothetical protein